MPHSEFYKLLSDPNTSRVRRHDITYRVDVGGKHDRFTTYSRLVSRFYIISIINIDFDIVPQGKCFSLVMVETPVDVFE